jgi:purine-cytosine permease-like protein
MLHLMETSVVWLMELVLLWLLWILLNSMGIINNNNKKISGEPANFLDVGGGANVE